MNDRDDLFYARWILANAAAEGIGLGSTLLLAHFVIGHLEDVQPGRATVLLGGLLAVAMGTVLEGAIVGWAQGMVIAARTPRIALGRWTFATAAGACIAWVLGMLPSTLAGLLAPSSGATTAQAMPYGLPGGLVALLGSGLGLALGVVFALPQWHVLHGVAPRAWRWLLANAAAWGIGMVTIWIGMDLVAWQAATAVVVAGVYGVCTVAGTLVGAVHGAVLTLLLSEADARDAPAVVAHAQRTRPAHPAATHRAPPRHHRMHRL